MILIPADNRCFRRSFKIDYRGSNSTFEYFDIGSARGSCGKYIDSITIPLSKMFEMEKKTAFSVQLFMYPIIIIRIDPYQ